MNWLERIHPPWFYRYMYFKSYNLFSKVSDIPHLAAEYIMFITVLFQFGFLIGLTSIVSGIDIWGEYITGSSKIEVGLFAILFMIITYLLFIYKKKWKRIVAEFEGESKKQGKRGFLYLLVYFLGSIGLFALGVWFVTISNPNYV
ncbi:hypothetical protein SAMN02927921_00752 [Sinomicrobium oceani]|uniref:Uncharacterized protein n=1 Tax=Sinomicrobium oceani TaxID=1150368 RepID=A0A1K1MRA1_9FLAO|nr:hypothetical protein [Sinomicrobium oceani]SFW25601.1 hypothetical protein SAMN02927921_00752 [Sinomicrobium oceani]